MWFKTIIIELIEWLTSSSPQAQSVNLNTSLTVCEEDIIYKKRPHLDIVAELLQNPQIKKKKSFIGVIGSEKLNKTNLQHLSSWPQINEKLLNEINYSQRFFKPNLNTQLFVKYVENVKLFRYRYDLGFDPFKDIAISHQDKSNLKKFINAEKTHFLVSHLHVWPLKIPIDRLQSFYSKALEYRIGSPVYVMIWPEGTLRYPYTFKHETMAIYNLKEFVPLTEADVVPLNKSDWLWEVPNSVSTASSNPTDIISLPNENSLAIIPMAQEAIITHSSSDDSVLSLSPLLQVPNVQAVLNQLNPQTMDILLATVYHDQINPPTWHSFSREEQDYFVDLACNRTMRKKLMQQIRSEIAQKLNLPGVIPDDFQVDKEWLILEKKHVIRINHYDEDSSQANAILRMSDIEFLSSKFYVKPPSIDIEEIIWSNILKYVKETGGIIAEKRREYLITNSRVFSESSIISLSDGAIHTAYQEYFEDAAKNNIGHLPNSPKENIFSFKPKRITNYLKRIKELTWG